MGKRIQDLNSLSREKLNELKKDVNRQLKTGRKRGTNGRQLTKKDAEELWQLKKEIEAAQARKGVTLKQAGEGDSDLDSNLDETPEVDEALQPEEMPPHIDNEDRQVAGSSTDSQVTVRVVEQAATTSTTLDQANRPQTGSQPEVCRGKKTRERASAKRGGDRPLREERRTLQSQFAEELAETKWDDRNATANLAAVEAEVVAATARLSVAKDAERRAREWKNSSREGVMRCRKDWGRFVDTRAVEKDIEENDTAKSSALSLTAVKKVQQKPQSAADRWLDVSRVIKEEKEAQKKFSKAEEQLVHHTEYGLSEEEAETAYQAAKVEKDRAVEEKDTVLHPELHPV